MKKVELVEAVAEETGLTKADATRAIDATFATITNALKEGDKVPVAGFGTLKEQHVKDVTQELELLFKSLLEKQLHSKQDLH